ncbi:MAG TPA: hypothetical protein VHX16_07385 [Chloroflexota bacterium]|nr:hypothetical protein [Chloroflexota bacterium]
MPPGIVEREVTSLPVEPISGRLLMSEFQRVVLPAQEESDGPNDEEIEDGEKYARLEVTKHMGKSFPLLPG